jgi:hypothetical protein
MALFKSTSVRLLTVVSSHKYLVDERKVHNSLSQRGRPRVGISNISNLSSHPPDPPTWRGKFVQALNTMLFFIQGARFTKNFVYPGQNGDPEAKSFRLWNSAFRGMAINFEH